MFKLVLIAGKMRGKEFELNEGENVIGRDSECEIHIPIPGISKKHFSFTVTGDHAYVKDLGSSNGTFLNGKMVKNATVKNGDKIALPDAVIQIVWVIEKKIIIKKAAESDEEEIEDTFSKPPAPPKSIIPKLIWIFRYKLMPHIHGLNHEYQWRSMVAISLVIFVFLAMYLTIFPSLEYGDKLLLSEVAKRGKLYAEEIARLNAKALEQKALDKVDTSFIENNKEVKFELFDLEGRVVRPHTRLNEYIQDPFSVKARDWANKTIRKTGDTVTKMLADGEIGIAAKISAYNHRTGTTEAVGVIALRFTPESIQVDTTTMLFLEALVTASLAGVLFFGIIYFLTLRPLEELKFQMDEVSRGRKREIELSLLMDELIPLKNSITSMALKVRELSREEGDAEFDEVEEAGPYINILTEFLNGANGPTMVLDGDKNLIRINMEAEEITSIRETGSEGMSLLDVAREQGFAATVIELCDASASNEGTSQQNTYELQGNDYNVFVTALLGKDSFAKGFYITFVRDE